MSKSKLFYKLKSLIRDPGSDVEGLYYPGERNGSGIRVNGKNYLIEKGDYIELPDDAVEGQTIIFPQKPRSHV